MNIELKKKVNEGFKLLRERGYWARQNWQCCSGCGWAAIEDKNASKAVFYHAQDARNLNKDGYVYIAWAGDGNEIRDAFVDAGLNVEWDGTENSRHKLTVATNH